MSVSVASGLRAAFHLRWTNHGSAGRELALHVGGIVGLTLVLASADAFGSGDLSLARRGLMFGIVCFLLVAQASLLADLVGRIRTLPLLGRTAPAATAILATLLLMTVEIHGLKSTPVVPYAPDPLPQFALFLAPFVVPVSGFVIALKWTSRRQSLIAAPIGMRSAEPQADAMLHGWPAEPVLRVQAVDHYLQLWMPTGTRLVRGTMRGALRRLPATSGVRVHRSWWVAREAIDGLERRGRDYVVRLADGGSVPVARNRVEQVRRFLREG